MKSDVSGGAVADPEREPLKVIVMAAGLSRRFGSNKLLAGFRGKPLIVCVFEALKGIASDQVYVVFRDVEVKELAMSYGFNVCYNPQPKEGQSRSIREGILCAGEASAYMFLTGDQPLLKAETLAGMASKFLEFPGKIMVAAFQGRRGSPVIFDMCYKDALLALRGDAGGRSVIQEHPDAIVLYEINEAFELADVDHLEDLAGLESI